MAAPRYNNARNPNNIDHPLARALTRLLSGPIINYRKQNPRQLRRFQLDKYASRFKSAAGLPFKKSTYSPFDNIYANTQANQARAERYIDFDQMEYSSIIAPALDIYSDEMTTSTALQPILNIDCANVEIKDVLHNLFYDVMNAPANLPGWCRSFCKRGDLFVYLDIDEKLGIVNFIGLPPQEIERLEGEDPNNPNYTQFQWNSAGLTLEQWQVAHFRIQGNDKHHPYGTSVLDPVRRIWRQLDLLENAMMAYRIVRSPERRVFYIDVGGIPDNEVEQHMQKIITEMKKNIVVDSDSGHADIRYNPMSVDEDIFIATRGGETGTKVEPLPGGQYTGDIDDVKYLRDKLVSGLKIPHSYLMQVEGADEEKTTLAQKDIRFARTISNLQQNFVSELEKIAIVHLFTLGYTGKDLVSFKLSLNNPSKIAELQELEHWRTKFEVAGGATEGYFSKRWVAKNILGLSDEEFLRNIREISFDAKFTAAMEAIAEGGEGEMGDLGELGGEEDLGDEDLGDTGEEDETLLAAPGKRSDEGYTTPGSNGKVYIPVKSDKRGMGARKRSMQGHGSREAGKNTTRNVWNGAGELRSLARGIYENYEANYNEVILENRKKDVEEASVHKDDKEVNRLVKSLKKSDWKQVIKETKENLKRKTDEDDETQAQ